MALGHFGGQRADPGSFVMAAHVLGDRDDDGGVGGAVLRLGYLLEASMKIIREIHCGNHMLIV